MSSVKTRSAMILPMASDDQRLERVPLGKVLSMAKDEQRPPGSSPPLIL